MKEQKKEYLIKSVGYVVDRDFLTMTQAAKYERSGLVLVPVTQD